MQVIIQNESCKTLSHAFNYINNNQQDENSVTIEMTFGDNINDTHPNSTFQQ